jgi:hypothetical protein
MWPSPGFEVRTGHADGEHVRPHNFRALTWRAVRLTASRVTNIADRIHALQTFSDPGDLTGPRLNGVKLSLHRCKIAVWRGQGSR